MNLGGYLLSLAIGYLLGSIPMGYVMGRLYGVDVRNYGSGKTGGTNLARLVGWPKTIPVAIGDPAKAVIAVLLARALTQSETGAMLAGLGALAGHNWSLYLRFGGGRGVGPTVGALLVFNPLVCAVSVALGFLTAVGSRYVSLGSIVGSALAIALSVAAFVMGRESAQHVVFAVIACSIIIIQHKDNMTRLLAGTERKLGERVQVTPEKSA
jgi:glycerol-3-phosphate acyltransferase PlsY